jgi:hypothetical protein
MRKWSNVAGWVVGVVLAMAVMATAVTALFGSDRPDSFRDAGRLVAGDQFAHDGRRLVVLGDGFDQLRAGPGEVVAADLATGRLERVGAGARVRWVGRSARQPRDWDSERGAD